MHKKIAKAVTSSLMAASMVASSVAALIPMSAAAGNCLGQNDKPRRAEVRYLRWYI